MSHQKSSSTQFTQEVSNMLKNEVEVITCSIIQRQQGLLSSQMMINDSQGREGVCVCVCLFVIVGL